MEKETFGGMITTLRKEKGMTQLELAEKMGVTDRAVSKWERDLSYPDINIYPFSELCTLYIQVIMVLIKRNLSMKFILMKGQLNL